MMSWVMKTMVLFSIFCSRRTVLHLPADQGIRAEKGSSRNQSSGPTASERAMPTAAAGHQKADADRSLAP
jgi:hypothetical protein